MDATEAQDKITEKLAKEGRGKKDNKNCSL